jgi:hypothetical protein
MCCQIGATGILVTTGELGVFVSRIGCETGPCKLERIKDHPSLQHYITFGAKLTILDHRFCRHSPAMGPSILFPRGCP